MAVLTGSKINSYRALVIATALELYDRTGMKANRMYTPKRMLGEARLITGEDFRGRDKYRKAAEALRRYVETTKENVSTEGSVTTSS